MPNPQVRSGRARDGSARSKDGPRAPARVYPLQDGPEILEEVKTARQLRRRRRAWGQMAMVFSRSSGAGPQSGAILDPPESWRRSALSVSPLHRGPRPGTPRNLAPPQGPNPRVSMRGRPCWVATRATSAALAVHPHSVIRSTRPRSVVDAPGPRRRQALTENVLAQAGASRQNFRHSRSHSTGTVYQGRSCRHHQYRLWTQALN